MRRLWALTVSALLLTGCSVAIPSDPQGTLREVSGGTLRVGVAPNGEFTTVVNGNVAGSEAELVEAFAESIDADIAWTIGSEEALVRALEREDLDLVIAGLTDASPWVARAGMTRPYSEFTDEDGRSYKLVMLVPMGENAFLEQLETFLFEEVGERP
jgi:ABC-type amino acid transport substrate-binding protein